MAGRGSTDPSDASGRLPLPTLPYTFRPRTSTGVVLAVSALLVATFVTLALIMPTPQHGFADALNRVAVAAGCLPLVVTLVLLGRPIVRAEAGGLVVRNMVRSRRLDWAEVVAVRFGPGAAWVLLDLDSGDTLAVMAIQAADGARGRLAAAQLAALVEAHTRTDQDG